VAPQQGIAGGRADASTSFSWNPANHSPSAGLPRSSVCGGGRDGAPPTVSQGAWGEGGGLRRRSLGSHVFGPLPLWERTWWSVDRRHPTRGGGLSGPPTAAKRGIRFFVQLTVATDWSEDATAPIGS